MAQNCTNHLMSEHKFILRAVYILKAMADRIEANQEVPSEDVDKLLHFFRKFGDDNHQCKEETVLFPFLRRAHAGTVGPALSKLMFEHDQERSLVVGLEDALQTKKGTNFVRYANQLAEILDNHIYKEDHVLFDLADRLISPEEDLHLESEMIGFSGSTRPEVHHELLHNLDQLELKYLGKAA